MTETCASIITLESKLVALITRGQVNSMSKAEISYSEEHQQAAKKCIACLEEINIGAKVCPKCQRDQSLAIQIINRFGGVVTAIGLLVTIIGAISAWESSRKASSQRAAAELALEKAEAVESRIEEINSTLSSQEASIKAYAKIIEENARLFYVSKVNSFRDNFNLAFGSCQIGPDIECFSHYKNALDIAYELMTDSEIDIYKSVDGDESISDIVCFYTGSIKTRSTFSIKNGKGDNTLAEDAFERSSWILENKC